MRKAMRCLRPQPASAALPPGCGRRVLEWPLLAPMAHVPEHPLVTARRAEMATHGCALGIADPGGDLVGRLEHRAHDGAKLVGAVGPDPACVQRIRRTGTRQLLAYLPVDPVAGKE